MIESIPEASIGPPKFGMVTKINLAILDFAFNAFVKKYLPAYKVTVTSEYRDEKKNAEIGGAKNSAHVHGLARDFVLFRPDGSPLSKSDAQKVFSEYVEPYWPGFALFEESASAKPSGYHIHVNLSRRVTTYAGLLAVGVVGFGAYKFWEGFRDGE